VQDSPPLDVLARADRAARLPRLGGMARPTGIVIVSERHWAFAGRDGSLTRGEMPAARRAYRRVPLLRGLVKLAGALAPLARGEGVASTRERLLLLGAVAAPAASFALPGRLGLVAGVALTAAMVVWLLRGRTLNLHGAEHRAIAAVERRQLCAAWAGAARPSRFSERCGTNFAALVLPVTAVADRIWPLSTTMLTPVAVTLVSLALTMELWEAVQASRHRLVRALLLPGLGLQRLTTREPSLEETRLALRATAAVLEREGF
jgi:uncharacterized protein YqhQ